MGSVLRFKAHCADIGILTENILFLTYVCAAWGFLLSIKLIITMNVAILALPFFKLFCMRMINDGALLIKIFSISSH